MAISIMKRRRQQTGSIFCWARYTSPSATLFPGNTSATTRIDQIDYNGEYRHFGGAAMAKRPYRASNVWTMTEARAKLSEIIDRAIQYGPQLVTKHGKPAAFIVSIEDWRRRQAGLPLVHEEQEAG